MRLRHAVPLAGLLLAACDHEVPGLPAGAPVALSVQAQQASGAASYIVLLRDSVTDTDGAAKRLTALVGSAPDRTYHHAVRGFAAHITPGAADALRKHPLVRAVEADAPLDASEVQTPATWGIDRVDQRAAMNQSYSYSATGAGVTAYILDSGIRYDHTDFAVSATDTRSRASLGTDVVGDGRNGNDCFGHGTHVAGTLGGRIHGVAKLVTLKAVRMFDCVGSGTVSGAIAGLDWMIADHPAGAPAVANLSINGDSSAALNDAVARTIADGIVVVVAAGNSAADACASSPASAPAALTVGATTFDDSRAIFSNHGGCVDLYAPGHAIISAGFGSTTSEVQYSGTSMAAPHVAGAVALFLQTTPAATPDVVRSALLSMATRGIVTNASGMNNHLLYTADIGSSSEPVTPPPSPTPPPPPPPPAPSIALSGSRSSGRQQRVDLKWSGAIGASVDLYRNGVRVTTTPNDGAYTDNVGKRAGTYTHRVCAAGTTTCSNTIETVF